MDNFLSLHVICSPKEEYLGIITAYVPTPDKWENNFKTGREDYYENLKQGSYFKAT